MKAKKANKLTIVKKLMDEGKSAREIHEQTKIGLASVYNYMTRVRKMGGNYASTYKARKPKLTDVNKSPKPQPNPEVQPQTNPQIQAVYDELGRLRNLILDKEAVIRYLEHKIALIFSNAK
jgi:transposase